MPWLCSRTIAHSDWQAATTRPSMYFSSGAVTASTLSNGEEASAGYAPSGKGGPTARPSTCCTRAASTTGRSLPPCSPVESLQTIGDALHHRIAKREFGAGTRVLLDRLVRQLGADPDDIRGPEAQSHFELALAVASGIADAALGARSAAASLHLGFVPVTWEPYELVVPGDRLGLARPLIEAVEDPSTQRRIGALTGYDLADAGRVFDAV